MLTQKQKADPIKESERNRQADVAETKQRVAEIEGRIQEIDERLEELAEADIQERKAKGLDKPTSPPLTNLVVREADLRIAEGSEEWLSLPPARQRVLKRARLERERREATSQLGVQRARLLDRKRLASIKLPPPLRERLQARVNAASLDLALRDELDGVFSLENESSIRRARAVLTAGQALGVTPEWER